MSTIDFNNTTRVYPCNLRVEIVESLPENVDDLILEILKSMVDGEVLVPVTLDLESRLHLSEAMETNDLNAIGPLVTSLTARELSHRESDSSVGSDLAQGGTDGEEYDE